MIIAAVLDQNKTVRVVPEEHHKDQRGDDEQPLAHEASARRQADQGDAGEAVRWYRSALAHVSGRDDDYPVLRYELADALAQAVEDCDLVVCTRSGDGVSILHEGQRVDVPVTKILPVDATGAVVEVTVGDDLYVFPPQDATDETPCRRWGWLASSDRPVLLLDMSWSMSWAGRFPAAKRVALAMDQLIRSSFPRDHFGVGPWLARRTSADPTPAAARASPHVGYAMGTTAVKDGILLRSSSGSCCRQS